MHVQAHGSDAMQLEEEECVFFLPHQPKGQIVSLNAFFFLNTSQTFSTNIFIFYEKKITILGSQ